MTPSEILGILGIIASIIVGLTVYRLDRKREDKADKNHKKIIDRHMDELNNIVSHIILDINELEINEVAVSERLNKFLIRKYSYIEFLINNIKLHELQCTKLSDDETEDIKNTVSVAQWILEKYCPQDIPEERRVNLWKKYNPDLKTKASTLSKSVTRFASSIANS
jgi:hypothetical protein